MLKPTSAVGPRGEDGGHGARDGENWVRSVRQFWRDGVNTHLRGIFHARDHSNPPTLHPSNAKRGSTQPGWTRPSIQTDGKSRDAAAGLHSRAPMRLRNNAISVGCLAGGFGFLRKEQKDACIVRRFSHYYWKTSQNSRPKVPAHIATGTDTRHWYRL